MLRAIDGSTSSRSSRWPARSQDRLENRDGLVVQSSERLVQQQHLRIMNESASDSQALPHAPAELADEAASYPLEPHSLEPFASRLSPRPSDRKDGRTAADSRADSSS